MFTGLIDDIGTIQAAADTPQGRTLRVGCTYANLAAGESVSTNGVCLTVTDCGPGWFTTTAMAPTLSRTAVGTWPVGRRVNLERAVRADDRLGGHMVQGHVDAVGDVHDVVARDDGRLLQVSLPADLSELTVLHGSIALDGVSLTVNALPADRVVQVALIDFTLRHTTLGDLRRGDAVHIEVDVLGKYVQRILDARGLASAPAARG